nr:TIGR02678 family protein [Desulfosporosinus sp. FKB]
MDKLGYHLIVHRHFVKLEKIPASPEVWMGKLLANVRSVNIALRRVRVETACQLRQ